MKLISASSIKRVITSPLFWPVNSGYALRIALMPVTGQYDVMFMPWMTHFVNRGHFNLFALLFDEFGEVVMQRPVVWAPYPYGFYSFTATWLEFLQSMRVLDLTILSSVWQVPYRVWSVFLFKLWYLTACPCLEVNCPLLSSLLCADR
jgi:hypothetical protein